MPVTIKRKIKQKFCYLHEQLTELLKLSTLKTITISIISYFIQVIILQHIFVNKGKINTSRFFFLCFIMRNLQKNLNKIWQTSRFTIPLFSNKNSRTLTPRPLHISINFEKVNPPFHLCRRRGGGRGPPTLICTKFHHYRIYVTGFKAVDLLPPPPPPICEQPQKNPS